MLLLSSNVIGKTYPLLYARDITYKKFAFQKSKPQPIRKQWIFVKQQVFVIQQVLYSETHINRHYAWDVERPQARRPQTRRPIAREMIIIGRNYNSPSKL